jgi:hypothetical protein
MSKGFSGEGASSPSRRPLVILGEMLYRTGNAQDRLDATAHLTTEGNAEGIGAGGLRPETALEAIAVLAASSEREPEQPAAENIEPSDLSDRRQRALAARGTWLARMARGHFKVERGFHVFRESRYNPPV